MKVLALAAAAVLLSTPAFAQSVPVTVGPALFNPINVTNVPLIVSGVGNVNTQAGVTVLDAREVGHIPALGPAAGNLAAGIAGFLTITRPNP
jgi:hypothetical protein